MNLFQSIRALLGGDRAAATLSEAESKELNHAIVELMLEMVKADFVELHAEKTAMTVYLSDNLGMDKDDVNHYLEAAELRTHFSISLESQTNVINNYLGHQQKLELMGHLWQLAKSDDEIHLLEENLFFKAGQLLGINRNQLDDICRTDQE